MKSKKYLCIHGHFYQPPRENAWTEEIELQGSAFPFHDWNERINSECYKPNSVARVIGSKGHIIEIANNFKMISYNFGPTLLQWLEKKDLDTYERIIDADKESIREHSGHGNAIAQVYNHIIMPLANRRDKVTQVKWGITDFKKRFGREPESIWLSETACNEETLEVLIEEKIKYIILEPHQAEKVKVEGSEEWIDVSNGNIDPKKPYRCYLKDNSGRFIDIFFYDGPISKAVGFEDILFDATKYMAKIDSALVHDKDEPQLISIATDGETYGHHKAFGDRALAFLLNSEAKSKGYQIVNYGEYLELYSPKNAVKLKDGENGDGTSWSCAHGVKRWKEHCGCRGDGPGDWTQHWRRPLRNSFDYLRDELSKVYESKGSKLFNDVWNVRNEYIDVVLDRTEENIIAFLKKHQNHELSKEEVTIALKLLEMQRYAMLMYTSCAWFFTELSGIETVQVIQYAAKAIELSKEISLFFNENNDWLEGEFLKILSEAKSNIPEIIDGRFIYENFVMPSATNLEKVAAHYAIMSMFEDDGVEFDMTSYKVKLLQHRKESYGNLTLSQGRLDISSKTTLESRDLIFTVIQFGTYDFRCSIKEAKDISDINSLEKDLFDGLYKLHVVELLRKLDDYFGEDYTSLKGLFLAERTKIIKALTVEAMDKVGAMLEVAYEENRRVNDFYNMVSIDMPQEMKFINDYVVNKRFKDEIYKLSEEGFPSEKLAPIIKIIDMAEHSNVKLQKEEMKKFLSDELESSINLIQSDFKDEYVLQCQNILNISKKIGLELDLNNSQVILFNYLTDDSLKNVKVKELERLLELAESLYISKDIIKKKVAM